ncbi:MAG TPA: acyl-CoA dehydratase activase [Rectinema sp.]|jgi:predicted CoA-substrate-specific enzyme activase|nr:2-hydroxyacyl-CoA dehydratase [Spirochaetia bacterium]HOE75169.1 acyl-CoA dehydratase activase [Rectinema sp.]HOU06277.1 acyl-CoA dehydratase activase [Rectinema sp.]HOW11259.1 acyl-CoA dehydratase activase [Rectinema sp.]HQE68460.1 acyl-CoA dehydratase activase [Rectinema sp.]
MIGYTCKYTPIELLYALGETTELLNHEVTDFEYAEKWTHPNLCCHAKAFLLHSSELNELVLINCCDSIRRAYDVLLAQKSHRFLFLFDLPHIDDGCGQENVKKELVRLTQRYIEYHPVSFDRQRFLKACRASSVSSFDYASDAFFEAPSEATSKLKELDSAATFIAIVGARVSQELLSTIKEKVPYPVIDATCGGNRHLGLLPPNAENISFDELMDWYAKELLHFIPCMRMANIEPRRALWENENLCGIIYNTVKFCDYYSFDYSRVKKEASLPILKIESDFTPQTEGQLSTRLEAFLENIQARQKKPQKPKKQQLRHSDLFGGIDSGSTTTKMVVIDRNRKILASSLVSTGAQTQKSAQKALQETCRQLDIEPVDLASIVSTGYGRNNIAFATDSKTEITCHAKGAFFLDPTIRTIVDIGGQDSKIIRIDNQGSVVNFVMNDKCAAGTGRFLEMMARALELDIDNMVRTGLAWKSDLTISSMCTVFAESEVVSLIADNRSIADIVHGLNKSIASRITSMISRAGGQAPYMMTGGVARNTGVVRELEIKLGERLIISEIPELCGALGAALSALELMEG